MKKFISFGIIFILAGTFSTAQDQYRLVDLVNNIDGEKVVFYNFLQDSDKLLVSSSLGIFQIEDTALFKISDITGPVKLRGGEIVTISRDEIPKSFDYNYLLELNNRERPLPTQKIDDQLFMITNGLLRIYKIQLYTKDFENLSIRSITENYIGSYSGIFQRENKSKISEIQTNSHIRELDSGVFVCYSALAKIEDDKTIFFRNQYEEIEVLGKALGYIVDIISVSGNYILFTTEGVYSTDLKNYLHAIVINKEDQNPFDRIYWPKFISIFEDIDRNKIVQFYFDKTIYNYFISTKNLNPIIELEHEVLHIVQHDAFIFLLDNKHLKKVRQGRKDEILIDQVQELHSFLPINFNRILLFSDLGIWLYDITKNSKVLISAEEVNYGAIYMENNDLVVGTTNGTLNFKITDLEETIIPYNKSKEKSRANGYLYTIILFLTSIIGYLLIKGSKSSHSFKTSTNIKEDIDNYIENHLAGVSVKSIETEFSISYTKLKSLYQTQSIGKTIKLKREQLAFELMKNGKSTTEISERTGYSISYLKKLMKSKKD